MFVNPAGSGKGYQIANSVRLRASASAYFSRTFGAGGDRDKWWILIPFKRSTLGAAQYLFGADTASADAVYFNSSDKLCVDIAGTNRLISTRVFRDPSAWGAFLVVFDASNGTNDLKLRVYHIDNGFAEITAWDTNTRSGITAGTSKTTLNTAAAVIGKNPTAANSYFDGYLSHFHIGTWSGSQPTPASFGGTDSNGVWVFSGASSAYGTQGSWFDFKDANLTAGSNVGLGKDVSGNGNYWNTNNISVTAGVTYDSMVDTPTNNYATLNPFTFGYGPTSASGYIDRGGLQLQGKTYYMVAQATFPIPTAGLFVFEGTANAPNSNSIGLIQLIPDNKPVISSYVGYDQAYSSIVSYGYFNIGSLYTGPAATTDSGGATYTTNDVITVAYDATNGIAYWYKNGVLQYTKSGLTGYQWYFAVSAGAAGAYWNVNFGQQPWSSYTATLLAGTLAGYKALCTANLPAVAIANPATGIKHRWESGSGIAANIASDRASWTNWIEIFKRTDTTEDWKFRFSSDTGNMMACNTNAAKVAWSAPSSGTYLGLAIQAEATYGCVTGTYTGDNTSNRNISHSLGKAPTCGIVKNEASGDWFFWHTKMTSAAYFTIIDSATPPVQSNTNTPWGTGNWSSTQFMVTNNATNNANANAAVYRYILFSDITGLLAMLGFTGNGSTDGAFEWAGQRPQIQIEKDLVATTGFYLFSDLIDAYNPTASYLLLNTTAATAAATGVDIVSNGIKHRSATIANAADAYAAISYARNPFGGSNVSPSPAR